MKTLNKTPKLRKIKDKTYLKIVRREQKNELDLAAREATMSQAHRRLKENKIIEKIIIKKSLKTIGVINLLYLSLGYNYT